MKMMMMMMTVIITTLLINLIKGWVALSTLIVWNASRVARTGQQSDQELIVHRQQLSF